MKHVSEPLCFCVREGHEVDLISIATLKHTKLKVRDTDKGRGTRIGCRYMEHKWKVSKDSRSLDRKL